MPPTAGSSDRHRHGWELGPLLPPPGAQVPAICLRGGEKRCGLEGIGPLWPGARAAASRGRELRRPPPPPGARVGRGGASSP
jgi:hypothetical protein